MQFPEDKKPRGYEYPRPSVESGQSQPWDRAEPRPLSREDAEQIRRALRDLPKKPDK